MAYCEHEGVKRQVICTECGANSPKWQGQCPGCGQWNTLVEAVIETAQEVTGRAIPATIAPRRPGDPAILVASSEKIRRELGWTPRYPDLREIMASAWAWHVAHPRGYAA